ncbi:MAG: hypothetical protein ABIP55_01060 [Tepidisphaeraceae bacterium]
MVEAPFLLLIVIVVVAFMLVFGGGFRRGGKLMPRACPDCGAAHPYFARFCRRCGKRL